MSVKQREIFEKFSATFPPETVARWERMVERWEGDCTAPNPYIEPEQSRILHPLILTNAHITIATTLQDVRLELARKETSQLASGYIPRHKVSMVGFFTMGFDIEDQQ
jgi:hypothetical protein